MQSQYILNNQEALQVQRIRVIQVNYGTPDLVIEGLHALQAERETFSNLSVILIDNCSKDDSVARLQSAIENNNWSNWVRLHVSKVNGGFAYANNLAVSLSMKEQGKPQILWLLNPDTQVIAGATKALVLALQENPRSFVGSQLEDSDGQIQCSAFRFPNMASEISSGFRLGLVDKFMSKMLFCKDINRPDWLAGASIMSATQTVEYCGDMDESYFLYFEEVDYLLHARSLGINCVYVPESRVIHNVGASTGISDERKRQPRRPKYWFASRRRYFIKNHDRAYLLLADIFRSLGYASWMVRKWLTRSEELSMQPPYFLRDFIRYSDLNPSNWMGEKRK